MTSTNTIIAVCGLQGAGKDTLANVLVRDHGFVKLSFGGVIKDMCALMFSWDRNMLEGGTPESRAWRETVDEWWATRLGKPGLTPRKVLQEFGTDVVRKHWHEDSWVACVERQLGLHERVVITDCRFPNEIDMLKRNGAQLVHIRRGAYPWWWEPYRSGQTERVDGVHASEWAWVRTEFDVVVVNNGTMEELEGEARRLALQHGAR